MLFIFTPNMLLKPFQHCLSFVLKWLKLSCNGPSRSRNQTVSIVCHLPRAAVKTGARRAVFTALLEKPNAQFCDVWGRGCPASAAAIMSSISSVGTPLGGCASGALPGRWWGAFSEGGRNRFEPLFTWFYGTLKPKIKPVRPLKSVLDNYNFLSSHVYSNGAQAVVIWDSRRFATPPSARASPTNPKAPKACSLLKAKRSNPARILSPVKSITL